MSRIAEDPGEVSSPAEKKKKKFACVNIPATDLDRLKEIAERERRSLAQQISYWIAQDFLNQLPKKEAS